MFILVLSPFIPYYSLWPFSPVFSLAKEVEMYQQEELDQLKHIHDMCDRKCDDYEIKKQNEVLKETQDMIPERRTRLQESIDTLKRLMVSEGRYRSSKARSIGFLAFSFSFSLSLVYVPTYIILHIEKERPHPHLIFGIPLY
jgi:hypothetical protein